MSFDIAGRLHKKLDTAQITATFKKREFVVELDGAYPQLVSFQLTQDKCGLLDSYNENETIKVFFDLRGREWTSPKGEVKYFNTLNAWKLEKVDSSNETAPPTEEPSSDSNFPSTNDEPDFSESDDLPF